MIINQNKVIKISLVFILLMLLMFQVVRSKAIIKEKKLLQFELTEKQKLITDLKNNYSNRRNYLSPNSQPFDIKTKTAEILSKINSFNLKLIDFSSSEAELNLNLRGEFNSILNFIYYLENSTEALKVEEFKIKDDNNNLFLFLKLKNELI